MAGYGGKSKINGTLSGRKPLTALKAAHAGKSERLRLDQNIIGNHKKSP